jgi:hypothetical protein
MSPDIQLGTPGRPPQTLSALLSPTNSWDTFVLFGESIPHLLHWDLAYFWVLERQLAVRPTSWLPRIEAWRRLVCMLLLGELELDEVPIEQPLLSYTQPRGITRIILARTKVSDFGSKPIGVLSPTVLIRPLPEPNRLEITAEKLSVNLPACYRHEPTQVDRRNQLRQALEYAKQKIDQTEGLLAPRLRQIIEHEILVDGAQQDKVYPLVPLQYSIPLLHSTDATTWESPRFIDVQLLTPQGISTQPNEFVPKCSCGALLTFDSSETAKVAYETIQIECKCHNITTFSLQDFGIWTHENTVFVWRDLHGFSDINEAVLPPSSKITGDEVWFTWNPAMLGNETARVNLKIRFPQKTIKAISPNEIKYNNLLVPGSIEEFSGYPIRPEWLKAVLKLPEREISSKLIRFRMMRLKGLAFPVSLPPYPEVACRLSSELQIGIFPKPMFSDWARYRFFWSTPDSQQYRATIVRNFQEEPIQQSVGFDHCDWPEKLPEAVALESLPMNSHGYNAHVGSTWIMQPPEQHVATQPIYIGVDFGTTTSVVCVGNQDGTRYILNSGDIDNAAVVFAGDPKPRTHFLPSGNSNQSDPSLIPSALWFAPNDTYSPIRWTPLQPSASHFPVHGFKWGVEHRPHRQKYLDELLFLVLPAALNKLFPHGGIQPNWNVGFAFPLAFDDSLRNGFSEILSELRTRVSGYAAGIPAFRSVNESYASVRAFGQAMRGEVFLIADLGGGSLDVALFEIVSAPDGRPDLRTFQVGSAKIGGEAFVNSLARRIGVGQSNGETEYWNIRDAITANRVANRFAGHEDNFAYVVTRFLPIALELLRVMVAAFNKENPEKQVQFILVGNGWRVAEFETGTPRAQLIARRSLEERFRLFEIQTLKRYESQLETASKHLVAIGALENARALGRHEIDENSQEIKMPAGRSIKVLRGDQRIEWHELVGTAIQNLQPGSTAADLDIDRQSGPTVPAQWAQHINNALPDLTSNPSTAAIRELLRVVGNALDRSPLQAILEKRVKDLA